eukprot:gnl/TRDRNA2_/TRDRNA2_182840_c0_seq1.p1 gnl/TRDRNA2_/TRDRNA2_182840_c0~~gnl/TRDRNA2_/TRDRNA2_182840_c0_seq1.p1  ORF type:complete len:408 (-),score=64.59 gnl/TRDRNA2_/TRDRNA2_182840_c0_seq1:63-1286(-)
MGSWHMPSLSFFVFLLTVPASCYIDDESISLEEDDALALLHISEQRRPGGRKKHHMMPLERATWDFNGFGSTKEAVTAPTPRSNLAGMGPTPEQAACQLPLPRSKHTSEDDPEPPVGSAQSGKRVRMAPINGMPYQLFLPASWKASDHKKYPVVVFLHGSGDGKFSVMNSQSLPRLLARDQGVSFDNRTCWCLEREYVNATAKREDVTGKKAFVNVDEDLNSPLADCDFADTFNGIAIMPQGWMPNHQAKGWTSSKLATVVKITKQVITEYRGDAVRVVVTGQSAGGSGAWKIATSYPYLWAGVNIICAPVPASKVSMVERLPMWIVGYSGDGQNGNDMFVEALKRRSEGSVRYTRYNKAPAPPDPKYRHMRNHASYDLIYRDPRLWNWAWSLRNNDAVEKWAHVPG